MSNLQTIKFDCEIRQVKSMVDHSVNIVLNIPEYQSQQSAEILKAVGEFASCAMVIEHEVDKSGTKLNK